VVCQVTVDATALDRPLTVDSVPNAVSASAAAVLPVPMAMTFHPVVKAPVHTSFVAELFAPLSLPAVNSILSIQCSPSVTTSLSIYLYESNSPSELWCQTSTCPAINAVAVLCFGITDAKSIPSLVSKIPVLTRPSPPEVRANAATKTAIVEFNGL